MKKVLLILCALFVTNLSFAQLETEKAGVEKACLGYIEGFYEGDTLKIKESIRPTLYKFGYWKDRTSGKYKAEGQMTFEEAVNYAKRVFESKKFAKEGAPKKVEVLDIMNNIAAAKITAWWGTDYMLLSKEGDKWMIEQVLWEGPLDKK